MFIPGPIIAAATFPGVVIHELAHQLFCRAFKVPVYEVCYFRFGNPAGYVLHGESKHWSHDVLISVGPFFLNTLIGAIFAFPVMLKLNFNTLTLLDVLLLWLSISIAMHAIPSTGDAKSMLRAVSGNDIAKLLVSPIVGTIYLLSLGSYFWLDLIYGFCVCFMGPNLLVHILS